MIVRRKRKEPSGEKRSIVRRRRKPAETVGQRQPRTILRRGVEGRSGGVLRLRKRWVASFVGLALLASVMSGAVWLWQSPIVRVQHIEVSGNGAVSEATILAQIGLVGESMVTADLNAAGEAIEALPLIASVDIKRGWPSRLRIVVREREPWGSWEQAGVRYTIDREGVVLGRAPAPEGSTTIVSTAAFSLKAGDRVDYQAVEAAIEIGEQLQTALRTRAVEVAYTPGEGVLVRTADGQTALLGDSSAIAYKLAVWARVAGEAASQGISYTAIDLRFGDRPVLR